MKKSAIVLTISLLEFGAMTWAAFTYRWWAAVMCLVAAIILLFVAFALQNIEQTTEKKETDRWDFPNQKPL
jgi:ABC-type arginine/histidine transport system permease subunit